MRNRRQSRRGSTLVEAALVSLLFFSMVFGVISLAYLIFINNSLAFLAQQGARWASVRGSNSGQAVDSAAVRTYVLTQATGLTTASLTVLTTWTPDKSPGSTVKVAVTYAAKPLVGLALPATLALKASSSITMLR